MHEVIVFTTSGCEELAKDVCNHLKPRLHINFQPRNNGTLFGKAKVERFSNQNIQAQVDNVRGRFVVVIHTQVPPVNENLIELFALLDAISNASPADVLLIFPYMPYSRSDRKNQSRISTLGCLLPRIISRELKIKKVILLDPHASHIKHYFEPAADEISAIYLMADYVKRQFFTKFPKESCVLVFADNGSAKRFDKLPPLLDIPVAYIDKGRADNSERTSIKGVVGNVSKKNCIVIDDEILTGGTSIGDAIILKNEGATSVYMFAVHPVLMDKKISDLDLMAKLEASPIDGFVLTDSIPVQDKIKSFKKFKILSITPFLAEAITRAVENNSLTDLHDPNNVSLYRP